MAFTLIQNRCDMKSYNELKDEIGSIQQQIVEVKKKEHENSLKEIKLLCKEFGFMDVMFKCALAKGCGDK